MNTSTLKKTIITTAIVGALGVALTLAGCAAVDEVARASATPSTR